MQSKNNPPKRKQQSKSIGSSSYGGGTSFTEMAGAHAPDDLVRNVPPHSVEAEQAVIGGVFLKPDSINSVIPVLQEEDFYLPAHKAIYTAFINLYQKRAPIDLVAVAEELKRLGLLEQAGGAAYLADLTRSIISAAHVEYYATLVRDKSMARTLITSCADIIASSYDQSQDVQALLDQSEQSILAISQRNASQTYKSSLELTSQVFEKLHAAAKNRDLITGVPTGYVKMDKMTGGLQPSDLIILAARPSMGKTALALNIAMRAAIRGNVPTMIYSLEMSMEQLMMRMLCAWAKVDVSKLRQSYLLKDDDWQALHDAGEVFRNAPIYIDDTPSLSSLELRARTRRLWSEKGIGLVLIDYLQLMRSARKTESRELEISDISRNLKAMAKELNVPVIALSQLNRKVEERKDKRPMLSDLRESGAIEQDADVIMFIYREAAYLPHNERPAQDTAEIIIGKQRNGAVGTVELIYAPAYTAFEDAAAYNPATDLG